MDTPRMTERERRFEEMQARSKWRIAVIHRLEDDHDLLWLDLTAKGVYHRFTMRLLDLYEESATIAGAAQIIADEFAAQ